MGTNQWEEIPDELEPVATVHSLLCSHLCVYLPNRSSDCPSLCVVVFPMSSVRRASIFLTFVSLRQLLTGPVLGSLYIF